MTNILDKEQFKKELEGKSEYKITFDDTDNIIDSLNTIYNAENELNPIPNIIIDLKKVSKENKIKALKYSLEREDLTNSSMILNILNMIKVFNTLDEGFFNNEYVYFTNLTELLDIKHSLKEELTTFITNLSIWFISIINSMHKVEYSYLDNVVKIPKVYERIIMISDFMTLSGIFSRAKPFSTNDLKLIENAYGYMVSLTNKSAVASKFLDLLDNAYEQNKTSV